jgi:O-antigen/teichoic acid export membrane protein
MARSITRGAFYLAIEKATALLSGVAYVALLSRWLGPTKYGIMTLALSFVGLATMATANVEVYLERYAAEYEARGLLRTLRRALLLSLAFKLGLGALAGALLVALSPWLAGAFHTPELATLVPLLVVIVAFDGLATTGRATLFGVQQYRWVAGLSVLFHIAKTVMVGVMWWTRQGLPELAFGFAALALAHGALSAAVPLWMLRTAADPEDAPGPRPRELLRSMMAYCTPLLGARITFMSGQNLSKILIGKLFDTTLLGYFSFAFLMLERLVEVAYTVPSSLLPPLTQMVVRGERERLQAVFDESLRLVQVMACALAFLIFAFARELTVLIGSPLFEPAWPLLRILALVPVFRTAQQPLTMLFQAMRLPRTVLGLAVIKFVTEFGSYFALVPAVGLAGACWANLAGAGAAYGGALMALHHMLGAGSSARLRAQARCLGLLIPLLAIAMISERAFGAAGGLAVKLALVPAGWIGIFGLGLVTRHDAEVVSTIPLNWSPMRVARDLAVRIVDNSARVMRPRRLP